MMKLLTFDSLITPSIVKFLFYIGVVTSVLGALAIIVSGLHASFILGLGFIVLALIVAVLGIIFSRVSAEMILVLFMIRDELAWQRERQETSAAN